MKSGKEITLTSYNENFKILAGAVENYKSPTSVFLNITTWLVMVEKVKNIDFLIKEYRGAIKHYLKNSPHIRAQFDINNIVDIDISPTGIKTSKPTFFELELNLYQKGEFLPLVKPKNSEAKDLKPFLEKIANDIINLPIFASNENFQFKLTKN